MQKVIYSLQAEAPNGGAKPKIPKFQIAASVATESAIANKEKVRTPRQEKDVAVGSYRTSCKRHL